MEEAWRKIPLTVQIATKLNRSHLIHGETAYLLPCLGRTEIDKQASGPQAVTVEDSTAHFHGSKGYADPASPHLLSEPKIVAELAKATLAPNAKVPWDEWVGDYAKVRHAMEETWPEVFKDFNERIWTPGGVERPIAARQRKWETKTGRANFLVPVEPRADPRSAVREGGDVLRLTTLRSNGQFNTTVYEYADRYRGVEGTRKVVFMNVDDVGALGLKKGDTVDLTTAFADNVQRAVTGFEVVPYPDRGGLYRGILPRGHAAHPVMASRREQPYAELQSSAGAG